MKLLTLDKDGTLVEPISDNTFVQSPTDQQLLPGVAEAVTRYHDAGYMIAIASNQGGVAAEHKTLDDAIAEMQFCMNLLPQINDAYFCPDLEGNECWHVEKNFAQTIEHKYSYGIGELYRGQYRKPKPGMIYLAIDQHRPPTASILQWHKENCLFVGDRPEDESAALAAGVKFMWADQWRLNADPQLSETQPETGSG